jgi:hypothetical protein
VTNVDKTGGPAGRLGVATRDLSVRLLNCSPSGCLLDTDTRLEIGATGLLQLSIRGDEFSDDVEVVRCQRIEGAGAQYRVGVRFLWTAPLHRRALRTVAWQWSRGELIEIES